MQSIEEDYESYKEQISEDTIIDNEEETLMVLRDKDTQSLFDGYNFDRQEEAREKRTSSYVSNYSTNHTEENFRRR